MTDDSDDDIDALVHPDIALITDYLAGELSPERMAEVRHRLETDAEFFERVGLIIHAWHVPPLHAREPVSREELRRQWAEFCERMGIDNSQEGDEPR